MWGKWLLFKNWIRKTPLSTSRPGHSGMVAIGRLDRRPPKVLCHGLSPWKRRFAVGRGVFRRPHSPCSEEDPTWPQYKSTLLEVERLGSQKYSKARDSLGVLRIMGQSMYERRTKMGRTSFWLLSARTAKLRKIQETYRFPIEEGSPISFESSKCCREWV